MVSAVVPTTTRSPQSTFTMGLPRMGAQWSPG